MIIHHHFKKFEKTNHVFKKNLDSSHNSDGLNFVESTRDLAANKLKQGLSDLRDGIENNRALDSIKKSIKPTAERLGHEAQKTQKRFESRGFSRLAKLLSENRVQVNEFIRNEDISRDWRENNALFAKAINRGNFSKEGIRDHVRYVQELLNLTQNADLKEDGKLGKSTMAELLRYQARKQNDEPDEYDFSKIS